MIVRDERAGDAPPQHQQRRKVVVDVATRQLEAVAIDTSAQALHHSGNDEHEVAFLAFWLGVAREAVTAQSANPFGGDPTYPDSRKQASWERRKKG